MINDRHGQQREGAAEKHFLLIADKGDPDAYRRCAQAVQQSGSERADKRPQIIHRTVRDRRLDQDRGIFEQREAQTGHESDGQQRLPFGRDEQREDQHRKRFDQFFRQRSDVGRHIEQILSDRFVEQAVDLGDKQAAAHADENKQHDQPRSAANDRDRDQKRERKTDKDDISHVNHCFVPLSSAGANASIEKNSIAYGMYQTA